MALPIMAAKLVTGTAAKKLMGFSLLLVGAGLAVGAVGQWKKNDSGGDDNNETKSSKDKMTGAMQWGIFAAVLLFVGFKMVV